MKSSIRLKAIIFDLDGTLLDSIRDIASAMNQALSALGYPKHSEAAYHKYIGSGQRELTRRALPTKDRNKNTINELSQKYWDAYDAEWYLSTRPFQGILHTIQLSVSHKIKLAILSNKPHYFTKKMIRHFFRGAMISHTKNPFGIYSGQVPEKPAKPDPTLALELAKRLKEDPTDIAFVGDMPVDIETAKNAGMIAIGAAWGYGCKEALQKAGADMIFDTPLELSRFIEELPLI
ncbi:MAG: HAD family hydrolase [Candidatus Cloacimonadaceae bacterium]